MPRDDERNPALNAELEKLREREAEKRLLHDRTIGGKDVPRPSVEFIRQNVGSLRSEQELQVEARANVDRQKAAAEAEARNQAVVQRSMREHSGRVEERAQKEAQERGKTARERMEQARLQREAQKNSRERSRT